MTPLQQWQLNHGISDAALRDLQHVLNSAIPTSDHTATGSEAAAQQRIRLEAPRHGVRLWRNNVGATFDEEHECPQCHHQFVEQKQPVRYGLANESVNMNRHIKSADLIGITPVLITAEMVGGTLGVFTSIECKRPGWSFKPNNKREAAQLSWAELVISMSGFAQFATDPEDIWTP